MWIYVLADFWIHRFLAARRVIHAGRGVRIFLIKRFLRIFLPYWPIALVLGAAYTLLPGISAAAALLLVLLPLLAAVLYLRSVEAWSLRLMQRAAQHST